MEGGSIPAAQDRGAARERLLASLVEDAFELIITVAGDLTVTYANAATTRLLGLEVDDIVGTSVIDHLHPEDADRALTALSGWTKWGSPAGATSFRVRNAAGDWAELDVTAASVTDGDQDLFAVYGRPADYQHATEGVLHRLLTGSTRAHALEPVLELFEWRLNGSNIAIAWYEPELGHQVLSTGFDARLAGAEESPLGPWAKARDGFESFYDLDLSSADASLRERARSAGLGGLWIEPVDDPATGVPALVTVWTRIDGPAPAGHAYGMQLARTYIELILRWCHQVTQLDVAAYSDSLTGLANRRSFFELIEGERRAGALLFCDLDGFKPVNDQLGHDAGDHVLREVARRIKACLRTGDVVARTGGDEFVVFAVGAGSTAAAELALRISSAVAEPIAIGTSAVRVGISIGIAENDRAVTEETLTQADRALLDVKAGRRGG